MQRKKIMKGEALASNAKSKNEEELITKVSMKDRARTQKNGTDFHKKRKCKDKGDANPVKEGEDKEDDDEEEATLLISSLDVIEVAGVE